MFRYETHLHTYPVSRCARATAEETVDFYKDRGYDGIFITNHFLDGNINMDTDEPYEKLIRFYFSDYHAARERGEKIGLKVFPGVELSYKGTDFLVYGLDEKWYLAHPEIEYMRKSEELTLMRLAGALIIQAHPFREDPWIDHIRLFPRQVEGVEVNNAGQTDFRNRMAALYAGEYGLLPFAGSDNHVAGRNKRLAGIELEESVGSVRDFIAAIRAGTYTIFSEEIAG